MLTEKAVSMGPMLPPTAVLRARREALRAARGSWVGEERRKALLAFS
jgi:hypothetical protein